LKPKHTLTFFPPLAPPFLNDKMKQKLKYIGMQSLDYLKIEDHSETILDQLQGLTLAEINLICERVKGLAEHNSYLKKTEEVKE
jgi:hypothetical protein